MKKLILGIACLMLLFTLGKVFAADGNNSRIQGLEADVADLQNQIDNIVIGASSGVKVYDDQDDYIGELVGINLNRLNGGSSLTIFYPPLGKFIDFDGAGIGFETANARVYQHGLNEGANVLLYESTDCTGKPYMHFFGFGSFYYVFSIRKSEDRSVMDHYILKDFSIPEQRDFYSMEYLKVDSSDFPPTYEFTCDEIETPNALSHSVTQVQLPPEFNTGIPLRFK